MEEVKIENVKRLMDEMGMMQKELATRSGLAPETLSRVLNGKSKLMPNTLYKIAKGLGVSVADLEQERSGSLNYAIQGYLQIADEITHITSFKQLKKLVDDYEEAVYKLPKRVKAVQNEENRNAKKAASSSLNIDKETIDFDREETIDASSIPCWSFRKAEDVREETPIDLGNMCISYHFTVMGREFTNSEALYICGLFSHNEPIHRKIQEKLIAAKSGYDAKKAIRQKYEKDEGRDDWESFNVEWMKWVVWQKIKGNETFRELLKSIPRNAHIIENSTHQKGEKAEFWGARNQDLEDKRSIIEKNVRYSHPTLSKKELATLQMQERNKINHIGVWKGKNCMGKILKYLQLCLLDKTEPTINYDLLREKKIHLFGKLLTFTDEAEKTRQKPKASE